MATTDVRQELVLQSFVDIHSNANYVLDRFNSLGEALARDEAIKIPNLGNLTVYADGSTRVDGATRQRAPDASITLTVDQEPWIPIQVPRRDEVQSLRGSYMSQLAEGAFTQLRNYIDAMVLDDYLATQVAWTQAGTYAHNLDAGSLAPSDILVARGLMLRQGGSMLSRLLLIVDPLAAAGMMGFTGWREVESNNSFGADTVGKIYGILVVETQAVRTGSVWSAAAATLTAAAVNTSIMTLTFSAPSGLGVGTPLTGTGFTATYDFTDEPILSVNATGTVVTLASTGANAADVLSAGIVTEQAAHNLLVDTSHVYFAVQSIPNMRVIEDAETTGDVMQVMALLGYLSRVGRVRSILSPLSAI